jgi:hypothetical protein
VSAIKRGNYGSKRMNIIDRIKAAETDKEKWALVIANTDTLSLELDNDATYIVGKEHPEDCLNQFDEWIGCDPGVLVLLEAIGVSAERV